MSVEFCPFCDSILQGGYCTNLKCSYATPEAKKQAKLQKQARLLHYHNTGRPVGGFKDEKM